MVSKEIEEMLNGKGLKNVLADFFRQAEEASGIVPIDVEYAYFKVCDNSKKEKALMKFDIIEFNSLDDIHILSNDCKDLKVTSEELLKKLEAYDEKLSSLLAENYGSRYIFKILRRKNILHIVGSKDDTECTEIFGVIEDTQK